jgi:hypothetical protein
MINLAGKKKKRKEGRGGLFFTHDPRQFDFQMRALGYEEPLMTGRGFKISKISMLFSCLG